MIEIDSAAYQCISISVIITMKQCKSKKYQVYIIHIHTYIYILDMLSKLYRLFKMTNAFPVYR